MNNPRVEKVLAERQFGCLPEYRELHRQRREAGELGEFYARVPKNPVENAKFRKAILQKAYDDEDFAASLWLACKQDILFFINVFCFIFEPRDLESGEDSLKELLFLTYDYQDSFIVDDMLKTINKANKNNPLDLLLEKSRDMGATWMVIIVFFWLWLFHGHTTIGLVSRIEELIDRTNNPGTLFWKIDFVLQRLPWFLKPRMGQYNRIKNHIDNPENSSSIDGYAASADVATGTRTKVFGMDEFGKFRPGDDHDALASTQAVCPCRIIFSSPRGWGAFAELAHSKSPAVFVVTMHWVLHPDKSEGLYSSQKENGRWILNRIDESYEFPEGYDFVLDGKIRSPWYDSECARMPIPRLIGQELDIDYIASGSMFFDPKMLRECRESCLAPLHRGDLVSNPDKTDVRWVESLTGSIKIWVNLSPGASLPPSDAWYAMGTDIASGTEGDVSSNSVSTVCNRQTGMVVAELVSNACSPDEFAELSFLLGRFFHGNERESYTAWEDNGYGSIYGKKLLKLGYQNYHRRKNERLLNRKRIQKGKVPGWASTKDTKPDLLKQFGIALAHRTFIEQAEEAIDECQQFIFDERGMPVHSKAVAANDSAHKGENHGDRVISRALCVLCMQERAISRGSSHKESLVKIGKNKFPANSYGSRRQDRLKKKVKVRSRWSGLPEKWGGGKDRWSKAPR
jgi:hypothetical protein